MPPEDMKCAYHEKNCLIKAVPPKAISSPLKRNNCRDHQKCLKEQFVFTELDFNMQHEQKLFAQDIV